MSMSNFVSTTDKMKSVKAAWDKAPAGPKKDAALKHYQAARVMYIAAADPAADDPALREAIQNAEFVVVQEAFATAAERPQYMNRKLWTNFFAWSSERRRTRGPPRRLSVASMRRTWTEGSSCVIVTSLRALDRASPVSCRLRDATTAHLRAGRSRCT